MNSSPHFTALTWNYSTALQHVLEASWHDQRTGGKWFQQSIICCRPSCMLRSPLHPPEKVCKYFLFQPLFASLLYASLPALLFQMNAASSALCVLLLFLLVWQPPASLNTCLCNSSFSLQNSPSTDVPLLCVSHHSAPLSTYLSPCCTLLCVSSLICAVKNPVFLFIDNCGKRWKLWRGVTVSLEILLARLDLLTSCWSHGHFLSW